MPLICAEDEADSLSTLIRPVDKSRFDRTIQRLHALFRIYAETCPEPLPAPGLVITREIRTQCELYLPLAEITSAFRQLYTAALSSPPILSSTPFYNTLSWADTFAALPGQFQASVNPARLLEALLNNSNLLTRFLFASFLPVRFYGAFERYPGQQTFIREWLATKTGRPLCCLDVACGTGVSTYRLTHQLAEQGFSPKDIHVDGWTLEPLEVWAALHRRFPHDAQGEAVLREATSGLLQQGYHRCINFSCRNILEFTLPGDVTSGNCSATRRYDLILCNGLLGGPIIHDNDQSNKAVDHLARLLKPGGILLAADNFHGGWKQKCPQGKLRASFESHGLKYMESGEGIGGLKPD